MTGWWRVLPTWVSSCTMPMSSSSVCFAMCVGAILSWISRIALPTPVSSSTWWREPTPQRLTLRHTCTNLSQNRDVSMVMANLHEAWQLDMFFFDRWGDDFYCTICISAGYCSTDHVWQAAQYKMEYSLDFNANKCTHNLWHLITGGAADWSQIRLATTLIKPYQCGPVLKARRPLWAR